MIGLPGVGGDRSDLDPEERGLEQTDLELGWGIPADYPERLRAIVTRDGLRLRR